MTRPRAALLGLVALCATLQVTHGQLVASSNAPLPDVAWQPSQKCIDDPATANCVTCNQIDTACIICLPGYGFDGEGNCRKCIDSLCLTCTFAGPAQIYKMNKCLTCRNVPTSNPLSAGNTGTPTYRDTAGKCFTCTNQAANTGCLTCNRAGTRCTKCNEGYYMDSSFICQPCNGGDKCKTCDTTGKCLECQQPPVLPQAHGLMAGGSGCMPCESPGCAHCNNNYKNCGTCMDGLQLGGVRGYGKIPGSPGKCARCSSGDCASCLNNNQVCTKCFTDVSPAFYANRNGACKKCPDPGCYLCNRDGVCTECDANRGFAAKLSGSGCEKLPTCKDEFCYDCRGGGACRQCNRRYWYSPDSKKCVLSRVSKCNKPVSMTMCARDGCAEEYGYKDGKCELCTSNALGTNPEYSFCAKCSKSDLSVCDECWPSNEFKPDPAKPGRCKRFTFVSG